SGKGNNVNVNDPTGGMIHVRFSESSAGTTMLLDAIDAAGNIRWTRALPDVFGKGDSRAMRVGVDRQGNVLAVWSNERRYGSPACEQQIEVVSPSGKTCGSSTFSMGGGSCSTSSIIVGYDGTVVQQGARERETCTAAGHQCSCTYRYWPGFFR